MDVVAKIKCVMQLTVTSISVPLVLQSGKTPLHVAAEKDHVDVVTKLLDGGADPNRKDCASIGYMRFSFGRMVSFVGRGLRLLTGTTFVLTYVVLVEFDTRYV